MLINFSDVYGLTAVDISTGSMAGEVISFSTNYDGKIKGLLVKRQNGDVVMVEPGRVLGIGSAAAVIDLDEQMPVVSPEYIEMSRIIGRPVISLLGDSVGELSDCGVDPESMEIKEFRLLIEDGGVEWVIRPGQVRTLGRHFIILNRETEIPSSANEPPIAVQELASFSEQAAMLQPEPEAAIEAEEEVATPLDDVRISFSEFTETRHESEPAPVTPKLLYEPSMVSPDEKLIKDNPAEARLGYESVESLPSPDLGSWQDQIDALVDKSMERTLILDNGGTQKTLKDGAVITKEIIEDLASEAPSILYILPLFVK